MKRQLHTQVLALGTLLLIGTLAVAQTVPQTKTSSSQPSSSTQPRGMAVDHAGGNGVRHTVGDPSATTQPAATTVAPAPATAARQKKHIAGVKYQEKTAPAGNGVNPLFESKDKMNPKSTGATGTSHQ